MRPEPWYPVAPSPLSAADFCIGLNTLPHVLAQCSPRLQEALMLARFEGLSQARIDERMGISVSMVEKHIAVALRHGKQPPAQDHGGEQRE